MPGLIDGMVDGQYERIVRDRITPMNVTNAIRHLAGGMLANEQQLAETITRTLLGLLLGPTVSGVNMSVSLDECKAFLASAEPKAFGAGVGDDAAITLQQSLNQVLASGVSWSTVFAKLFAIYTILTGPGSWLDKATAILALFGQTPGPMITVQ